MSPYTFSSIIHCTDGHIAGLASKLFFAKEFEESLLASVVGLSRFTHVTIRFDSVRSRSDRFDPIHYPFVQTNTTKISNSECHLNDLLK